MSPRPLVPGPQEIWGGGGGVPGDGSHMMGKRGPV